jgi:hypothetical protein
MDKILISFHFTCSLALARDICFRISALSFVDVLTACLHIFLFILNSFEDVTKRLSKKIGGTGLTTRLKHHALHIRHRN